MLTVLDRFLVARMGWPSVLRLALALVFVAGGTAGVILEAAAQSESQQLKRFRRADSYLRSGNVDKAIPILESLYRESPDKPSFYRKLKEAYESVKRYDDALRLLENRMGSNPRPIQVSEKARLLYQKGEEQKAADTWEKALSLAPEQPSTYRVVYQTLVDIRRYKQAIDVLNRARSVLDNESLFRTELAYLYGLDGQHASAMREYVSLLEQAPERTALVRNRLQTFVEQGEGISSSIEVLTAAVEQNPLNPAFRELLAWVYMKTDRYDEAYDVYRALDRLQQKKGRALFTFAQKASDASEYAVATTALEVILERHPEAPVAPEALRALGQTYQEWAKASAASPAPSDSTSRYAEARAAYGRFLERYPNHSAAVTVRTDLGLLQLDVYRNLSTAEETLQQVVSAHPETRSANEARYALARIALLRGEFDRARLLFTRLGDRLRSGDLADQSRFELALLHFYQGNFDAAIGRANVTSKNASADVANDAISLRVLIQQNRGPDSLNTALRQYAQARLFVRQHRYDRALEEIDSLLTAHPRHSLSDDARFKKAEILLAQGDTSQATAHLEAFPQRYPRSPLADKSLLRLGKIHEDQGRADQAEQTYNLLLTEYPKSLYTSDARSRLRKLQSRG